MTDLTPKRHKSIEQIKSRDEAAKGNESLRSSKENLLNAYRTMSAEQFTKNHDSFMKAGANSVSRKDFLATEETPDSLDYKRSYLLRDDDQLMRSFGLIAMHRSYHMLKRETSRVDHYTSI